MVRALAGDSTMTRLRGMRQTVLYTGGRLHPTDLVAAVGAARAVTVRVNGHGGRPTKGRS
jgi:hypothetical protein